MNPIKVAWLVIFTSTLFGCAHKVDLAYFDEGTSVGKPVLDKNVAIVVEPGAIQDNHDTQSDVYTYQFRNVTDGIVRALKKVTEKSARKVVVLEQGADQKKENIHYFFHPEIRIRSVNDFWTMGCLIKYRLQIKNKKGDIVADEKGEGKRNFFANSQAQEKCQIAMNEVFEKVTNKAAATLK